MQNKKLQQPPHRHHDGRAGQPTGLQGDLKTENLALKYLNEATADLQLTIRIAQDRLAARLKQKRATVKKIKTLAGQIKLNQEGDKTTNFIDSHPTATPMIATHPKDRYQGQGIHMDVDGVPTGMTMPGTDLSEKSKDRKGHSGRSSKRSKRRPTPSASPASRATSTTSAPSTSYSKKGKISSGQWKSSKGQQHQNVPKNQAKKNRNKKTNGDKKQLCSSTECLYPEHSCTITSSTSRKTNTSNPPTKTGSTYTAKLSKNIARRLRKKEMRENRRLHLESEKEFAEYVARLEMKEEKERRRLAMSEYQAIKDSIDLNSEDYQNNPNAMKAMDVLNIDYEASTRSPSPSLTPPKDDSPKCSNAIQEQRDQLSPLTSPVPTENECQTCYALYPEYIYKSDMRICEQCLRVVRGTKYIVNGETVVFEDWLKVALDDSTVRHAEWPELDIDKYLQDNTKRTEKSTANTDQNEDVSKSAGYEPVCSPISPTPFPSGEEVVIESETPEPTFKLTDDVMDVVKSITIPDENVA